MNKLEQLEQKYKELGAEIERLKRPKTGKVLKPSYLNKGDRYYHVVSNLTHTSVFDKDGVDAKRIKAGLAFYDEQSAINHRDARLLAHECDIAIAESWDGEEIDCNNTNQPKCHLTIQCNLLKVDWSLSNFHRFAFKKREHAESFCMKHGEEAVINMLRNY